MILYIYHILYLLKYEGYLLKYEGYVFYKNTSLPFKIIALIRENSRSNFKNMQIVDSINTA